MISLPTLRLTYVSCERRARRSSSLFTSGGCVRRGKKWPLQSVPVRTRGGSRGSCTVGSARRAPPVRLRTSSCAELVEGPYSSASAASDVLRRGFVSSSNGNTTSLERPPVAFHSARTSFQLFPWHSRLLRRTAADNCISANLRLAVSALACSTRCENGRLSNCGSDTYFYSPEPELLLSRHKMPKLIAYP